ncbi:MAG: 50S ribosomal protein L11 methyltransferase [Acidobacteriota bacterium]|nr:50S ribosomal protein L11 methyltransferase [Acidobacteriota bacterium]MDQ5835818.1 50S ribosomal protein L11 methyltransferase [Acidobacteriota bacterium]
MKWFALDVTLQERAREAVEYALMEAGALGTESDGGAQAGAVQAVGKSADDYSPARVTGYFDSPPEVERVRAALLEALRIYGLASSDVREMRAREVEERDWLAEWKKGWRPTEVGRFVVAPPWCEVPGGEGQIVIRVEPGMAFGTGTHETTRLCLAAIERHFRGGSFLDVGTGTGILAIAAAKLDPSARVEACDTDALAVTVAEENARRNGVAERIRLRVGSVDETTASADFVCANLTADVILALLPALVAATCGRLVLSGILAAQSDALLARLRELGVGNCEVTHEGEWVALVI